MTAGYGGTPETRPGVDAGRLWAGGIASAVVAALVAIVGLLIARGVFHVVVLEPKGAGIWGNASTATYAIAAAVVALLATALVHLLCLGVPAPSTFFGWIMVLATLIAVVIPLTLTAALSAKIATAAINLAIGLVITLVINTMAASARTVHTRKRAVVTQNRTEQFDRPLDRPPTSRYDA
jgi:hypothetical protein